MASGVKYQPLLQKITQRHLQCQICMDRFKEPKMLECSHSFCLKCLQQLADTNPTCPKLICPVCRSETLLIGKGVDDLRTDFTLTSLLDDIEQHETELQSQKDNQPPSQGTVSKCSQHTDKDVIMYCDSCKLFICTTCIAKDHRMHPATEINDVADNCKKKANEILAEVGQHHNIFNIALQDIATSRNTLASMFAATQAKISKKAEEDIAKEVARIREEEKKLMLELQQIYKDRAKTIEIAETTSKDDMTKAKNKKDRVDQLMDTVNFSENQHLIEKLLQDLKDYTEMQPKQVPHDLAYMDFEEDQKSFGRLRIKEEQKLEAAACAAVRQPICKPQTKLTQMITWILKRKITTYKNRHKKIQNICASDVASYCNSDVVVRDLEKNTLIKILADNNAQLKVNPKELSIRGLTFTHSVTLNNNDELIVVDTKTVTIFNRKIKCLHQFTLREQPSCIAVYDNNVIAVGYCNQGEISQLKQTGSLIRTLSAPGIDEYLTTYKQQLIYTSTCDNKLVSIDYMGRIVFSVDINQSRWPRGVCCDKGGSIYVAIWDKPSSSGEIHHYSPNGEYIGCIIKGCAFPHGITLTPAGDLVVATDESVQIYRREDSHETCILTDHKMEPC